MPLNEYRISDQQAGQRIDIAAAACTGMTRSRMQKALLEGSLTVHGSAVKANYRVKAGDLLQLRIEDLSEQLIPEDIPLLVLYQDEWLVVIDKPGGLVMYPAAGHRSGTLMNALAFRCGNLAAAGGPLRPGVVHRLDKDTSGVLVVALKDEAYYPLVQGFRDRTIERRYAAIVSGIMNRESGEIEAAIGRSETHRKKMSTRTRRGRSAYTTWKVKERFRAATLIEAKLGTGRTHQIRVHFASIGHPLIGDEVYGRKTAIWACGRPIAVPRQMLHAELLGFRHPVTGEDLRFESRLPDDMLEILRVLKEDAGR